MRGRKRSEWSIDRGVVDSVGWVVISGSGHNRVHGQTLNLWALQRSRSMSKSVELTVPPLHGIVMPIPPYVSDLHDENMLQYSTPTAQSGRSIAPPNKLAGRCTPCGTSERSECAMEALFGRRQTVAPEGGGKLGCESHVGASSPPTSPSLRCFRLLELADCASRVSVIQHWSLR